MIWTIGGFVLGLYVLVCLFLYFQQERLMFFPERLPAAFRYTFAQPFEEVTLPAAGATLNLLHFKAAQPRGVVLYWHGNAGSLQSWGSVAEDFLRHNYAVVIPDYRGYGKSTGTISGQRQLEADAELVHTYVREQYPAMPIVLYGRSLGSGLATYLATKYPPRRLILETPYFSLKELATKSFPFAPSFLLKYPLRTDRWIGAVQSPVALIHGTNDTVIPYDSSERLLPLITGEKRLITIRNGSHNDLGRFPAYHEALAELLAE